jgi:hypothetical protein
LLPANANIIYQLRSLPPATISSVPITDFAVENAELANVSTDEYYSCCGKSICRGCIYSLCESGNNVISVRFAIPTDLTKPMKKELKN